MTAIDDGPLFVVIRAIKKAGKTQDGLTQAEVDRVKAILAAMLSPPVEPNASIEASAGSTTAPKKPITALALAMGIAAAAITVPFVSGWENGPQGPALIPYRDIVGVWTQCSGETLNVTANSPTETPEGCAIKLDTRLAGFARDVAACTPSLKGRDAQWAAATSLAYNIGTSAYCRSTVDRRFDAGDAKGACDAFLMWNRAGGRVVAGLTNRRRAERDLCLKGV